MNLHTQDEKCKITGIIITHNGREARIGRVYENKYLYLRGYSEYIIGVSTIYLVIKNLKGTHDVCQNTL